MHPRIRWLWVQIRLVLRPTVDGLQFTEWRRNRPASHEVFQWPIYPLRQRVAWTARTLCRWMTASPLLVSPHVTVYRSTPR